MVDTQNLDGFFANPVAEDIRQSRHGEFAYGFETTHKRVLFKPSGCFDDPLGDVDGRATVVLGDVVHRLVQIT